MVRDSDGTRRDETRYREKKNRDYEAVRYV